MVNFEKLHIFILLIRLIFCNNIGYLLCDNYRKIQLNMIDKNETSGIPKMWADIF